MECLNYIYSSLKSNHNVSIEFISVLFGKLCFLGYSEIIGTIVLKYLIKNCIKDPLWNRISQSLFKKIPFKYLESSLTNLVTTVNQ